MINNIFYLSLLEQNIVEKRQVDKNITKLEFKTCNSKEYKMEAIWDSTVYTNKAKGHLPGLYYLLV